MKAFFMAQFSYCPLTRMFHSRKLKNEINKLHERCLWIVYCDKTSSFEKLLETDNSVSVHHRNIQVLGTELHKIVNRLSPETMKEVFPFNENTSYNARNKRKFHSRSVKSVAFGSEMLSHLAPKIWELVLVEIKNAKSVASFKRAIKKWKTINCLCRLCRTYVFLGWFRVIYFMIRHKPVFLFLLFLFVFFPFSFVFIILDFFVILDSWL